MLQRKKPLRRRTALRSRKGLKPGGSLRAHKVVKSADGEAVPCTPHGNAAAKLWTVLKDREIAGLRFQERERIGPYVVDFICPAARLVLLLEGAEPNDPGRMAWLRANGYRTLVFAETDVLADPQIVIDAVARGFELRIVKS